MPEDEYARAKLEEHARRLDRNDTLFDRLFAALDSMNSWRARTSVYILIGAALVSWVAFRVIEVVFAGALANG